jgi:hypothetical protein
MSGLALSFVPRLPEVRLNPEIVFYFFLALLQTRPPYFSSFPAYSGSERAQMVLSDRANGQNCFASQGEIGLF